ncbi:hypothetical protein YC2023_047681 [Brassica napus]
MIDTVSALDNKKGQTSLIVLLNYNNLEMDFFSDYGDANRFKIQEVIGKGNYGVVGSAIDTLTGSTVSETASERGGVKGSRWRWSYVKVPWIFDLLRVLLLFPGDLIFSTVGNAMKVDSLHRLCSSVEPILRRVVSSDFVSLLFLSKSDTINYAWYALTHLRLLKLAEDPATRPREERGAHGDGALKDGDFHVSTCAPFTQFPSLWAFCGSLALMHMSQIS